MDEDASSTIIALANVFSDIESDTLALTVVSNDTSLVTAAIVGTTLTLTYVANANGNTTVMVTATESSTNPALSASHTFSVIVNAVNDAPTVQNAITDVTVDEDASPTTIALASVFADIESDTLVLSVVSNNTSLVTAAIVDTTLTLTYLENAYGNTTVVVTATENHSSNVDIYVSSGSTSSPYYQFYSDSNGITEITDLSFDTVNTYTFRRVNNASSHPFYISDIDRNTTPSSKISITGDGSISTGISGSQSFILSFDSSFSAASDKLTYFCTVHGSMTFDWNSAKFSTTASLSVSDTFTRLL